MSLAKSASDGCYEAARAAALSGVPKTTVYWWARQGIVVPSVSPVCEKLWSYSDLMALRVVSWLRHPKAAGKDVDLPASPMPKVRKAFALLDELGLDQWSQGAGAGSPLLVDWAGEIYVRARGGMLNLHRQPVLLSEDVLGLTAPFESAGLSGPDLLRPRPHLRIVPSKVAGEPHVEHSRLTTQTIAALADRGYPVAQIAAMHDEPEVVIGEAIDLERQLAAA
jgi:uncharacterized protein (DUF433 family)